MCRRPRSASMYAHLFVLSAQDIVLPCNLVLLARHVREAYDFGEALILQKLPCHSVVNIRGGTLQHVRHSC